MAIFFYLLFHFFYLGSWFYNFHPFCCRHCEICKKYFNFLFSCHVLLEIPNFCGSRPTRRWFATFQVIFTSWFHIIKLLLWKLIYWILIAAKNSHINFVTVTDIVINHSIDHNKHRSNLDRFIENFRLISVDPISH